VAADLIPSRKPPVLGTAAIAGRASKLPVVLAGPILRAVTESSVTVWLALRTSASLTLQVFTGTDATPLFQGTGTPFQLGDNLYVLALTAKFQSGSLLPGTLYSYNINFTGSPVEGDLLKPGIVVSPTSSNQVAVAALCYGSFQRPTFVTPASDLTQLRIAHGSCRKPHAESHDALAILDDVINNNASNVANRPQQLFFTGDQIYADEIPQILSGLTTDAADYLIGPSKELLPELGVGRAPGPTLPYGPAARGDAIAEAKFTTGSPFSHLMSFGEYAANYIFTWADTVWPGTLPAYNDLFPGLPQTEPVFLGFERNYWAFNDYTNELPPVEKFREDLPKVRRALANIATYMVVDDHDVTDDLFMNRDFCEGVLGAAGGTGSDLGRRILFNGFLAYVFFQGWGNTGPTSAGTGMDDRIGELQSSYQSWRAAGFPVTSADLDQMYSLLGLPDSIPAIAETDDPAGIAVVTTQPKDASVTALPYNYQLGFTAHEVMALDSRLHRAYPRAPLQNCALISDDSIKAQIDDQTPGDNRITFVLAQRPPREHPFLTYFQEALSSREKVFSREVEAWAPDVTAYEGLFSALSSRGSRNRKVVMLSGDVHYGSAYRHQYWSDHPFVDPQRPTTASAAGVFALFTSSAFKNQTTSFKKSIFLHLLGFAAMFFRPFDKRDTTRLTWNHDGTDPFVVGHVSAVDANNTQDVQLKASPGRGVAVISNLAQAVYEAGQNEADETVAKIDVPPDAIAKTTFITSTAAHDPIQDKMDTKDIDLSARLATYTAVFVGGIIGTYDRNIAPGAEFVGTNNLGVVSFTVDQSGESTAVQDLWWFARDTDDKLVSKPFGKFAVSLKIEPKPTV
jgi:hypothetical protein